MKLLFLMFLTLKLSNGKCPTEPIKYDVQQYFDYHYETSKRENKTISSLPDTFAITVTGELQEICKGLLEITLGSHYFWLDRKNLSKIEPGAFDGQNITEEIRLGGNKLSILRKGTFKNLSIRKLDVSNNQITTVEEGAFEDLPNLWNVFLGGNKITEFYSSFFINTPAVRFFAISNNNLKKVGPNSFSFMTKTEMVGIGLGDNLLEQIDPRAFDGVTPFTVGFNNNKLKTLPNEIFSSNNIRYLDLKNNLIQALPEAFWKQPHSDTDLRGNPLTCEEQRKVLKYINTTKGCRPEEQVRRKRLSIIIPRICMQYDDTCSVVSLKPLSGS